MTYRFFLLKNSFFSYTSLDLTNKMTSVLFNFSITFINFICLMSLTKLSLILALTFNNLTKSFFKRHSVDITRLIQLKMYSSITSQNVAIVKNSLTLSSCSSFIKSVLKLIFDEDLKNDELLLKD
jgi:hypothetical protein